MVFSQRVFESHNALIIHQLNTSAGSQTIVGLVVHDTIEQRLLLSAVTEPGSLRGAVCLVYAFSLADLAIHFQDYQRE